MDVGTTGKLVSSACYDAASLCLSATVLMLDEPISVKLRFLRGALFEGNHFTQWHQITSLETRNSRLSYGENPMSLSDLGLIRYRVVIPGQTDGQNSHHRRKLL